MLKRLLFFLNPFDGRYEDLKKGDVRLNVFRDFTAGLIVAMVAIPLAMGFAMASGLRPEQGIVGGAVAGLVGALFGGSKYQVYGPTAAYIPVIGWIMSQHDHGFLVLASLIAGVLLMVMGLFRLGRIVNLVPHSIVVGFTIGIAVTIALSQVGEVLGLKAKLGYAFIDKVEGIWANRHLVNGWALLVAIAVFGLTKGLLRLSIYVPAPLIAIGVATWATHSFLVGKGLTVVADKYGKIPTDFWVVTPPSLKGLHHPEDLAHAVAAIIVVAAIESLLCSRMADRLANNTGQKFHANKELWGQGLVQIFVPLLNGFPHTGALARTATNIKVGALSPLAGVFKCILKLLLAAYLASWLESVPTACIGGILLYVAFNMVKPSEVTEVLHMGRFHVGLMIFTAGAVIVTDFLTGVVTALVIYAIRQVPEEPEEAKKPAEKKDPRVRADLGRERAEARHPGHHEHVGGERKQWLSHIRRDAHVPGTAFVHPDATVIGRVVMGDHVHVAADTSLRADEGAPFFIGPSSNVQDGVVMHALKEKFVRVGGEEWAIYVGRDVSIAHGALVHGPSYIGDETFLGFKSVVHDSVVGARCFVGIGAVVVGVEIPDERFVPHGAVIDTPEKVRALPPVSAAQNEFNEDVVGVNRGLAAAYREHIHGAEPWRPGQRPTVAAEVGWEPPARDGHENRF